MSENKDKKTKKTISYNNVFSDLNKLDKILEDLQSITTVNKITSKRSEKKIEKLLEKTKNLEKTIDIKYGDLEDMVDDEGNLKEDAEIELKEAKDNLDNKK